MQIMINNKFVVSIFAFIYLSGCIQKKYTDESTILQYNRAILFLIVIFSISIAVLFWLHYKKRSLAITSIIAPIAFLSLSIAICLPFIFAKGIIDGNAIEWRSGIFGGNVIAIEDLNDVKSIAIIEVEKRSSFQEKNTKKYKQYVLYSLSNGQQVRFPTGSGLAKSFNDDVIEHIKREFPDIHIQGVPLNSDDEE